MKQQEKFEAIVTSYINGNIADAKASVKSLSKADRKNIYLYVKDNYPGSLTEPFFFNLI